MSQQILVENVCTTFDVESLNCRRWYTYSYLFILTICFKKNRLILNPVFLMKTKRAENHWMLLRILLVKRENLTFGLQYFMYSNISCYFPLYLFCIMMVKFRKKYFPQEKISIIDILPWQLIRHHESVMHNISMIIMRYTSISALAALF